MFSGLKTFKNVSRQLFSVAPRLFRRGKWLFYKAELRRRFARGCSPPSELAKKRPVLFFAPEADVAPHFTAHAVLARTLQERGHAVVMARCLSVFERCPAMDNFSAPFPLSAAQRAQACSRCVESSIAALEAYGLPALDLRPFNDGAVNATVERALQNAPANLLDFEYDGVRFGMLTANALSTICKIADLSAVDGPVRARWLAYIRTSVRAYLLTERLLPAVRPSAIVVYNDYPIFLAVRLMARRHGVRVINIGHVSHRNLDRRRIMICPQIWNEYYADVLANWPERRELALSPSSVHEIVEDLRSHVAARGSHQYSPPTVRGSFDLRAQLGIPYERKLIVAYTSSLDEIIAGDTVNQAMGFRPPLRTNAFADQIEWLKQLVAWIEKRPNLELVVRVHPREGRNKRDSVSSQHLARLQEVLTDLPARCRVIWPGENISSYDLAEAADLALVSWSSIALELARLGVPVLGWGPAFSLYPSESFSPWLQTPSAYFSALEEALTHSQTNLDTITTAFRCYYWFHLGTGIELGGVISDASLETFPKHFQMPERAAAIERCLLEGKTPFALRFEEAKAEQTPDAQAREQFAMRAALARFLHETYVGEAAPSELDVVMENSSAELLETVNSAKGYFKVRGQQTDYRYRGITYRRYSPLYARLITILYGEKRIGTVPWLSDAAVS